MIFNSISDCIPKIYVMACIFFTLGYQFPFLKPFDLKLLLEHRFLMNFCHRLADIFTSLVSACSLTSQSIKSSKYYSNIID